MGKSLHNDVFDGSLNIIRNNSTRVTLCSAEPLTYAEANATYALADVTVDSTDYTIADGDTSGRKITCGAQNSVPVDVSGSGNHVAHLDVVNLKLLGVTTCTAVAVTAGGTVNIGSHTLTLPDPT